MHESAESLKQKKIKNAELTEKSQKAFHDLWRFPTVAAMKPFSM